ncbi:hypothetical protein [Arthrobacter sp. ISL-28]|uniref:hypothetical protein n=1 Tax=Arthrobacter sp. ISL-28 TaxID=2819108 RepID=UPI001BE554A2|nr:hypothetical protein [Arthrobacter sp. ISL-28]MBT2522665.1 hypothetical protein [Arthrobacter sp. ISL-28]
MNPDSRTISGPLLSRRQFGLVVGGGAFLLVAGGTYGAVSRRGPHAAPPTDTGFGSLSVTRAGRLARLDAQGNQAFLSVDAAAAWLTGGAALAAGSVAAVAGSYHRAASPASVTTSLNGGDHGHGGGTQPVPRWPQPVNLTWGDVVLVEVELTNASPEPVLFSPGQLRLRLAPAATTVTPQDAGRGPGTIAAGATEHHWISYLAPLGSTAMDLEFTDPWEDWTLGVSLPALAA